MYQHQRHVKVTTVTIIFCGAFFLLVAVPVERCFAKSIDFHVDSAENEISDEFPFKVETDYERPTRCEDSENGQFYKLGDEWYDLVRCEKRVCDARFFPQVNVISCDTYFEMAQPEAICKAAKRGKWPRCCEQCKKY